MEIHTLNWTKCTPALFHYATRRRVATGVHQSGLALNTSGQLLTCGFVDLTRPRLSPHLPPLFFQSFSLACLFLLLFRFSSSPSSSPSSFPLPPTSFPTAPLQTTPPNHKEFFFKCSRHPTTADEQCVALHMVRKNTVGVDCASCFEQR